MALTVPYEQLATSFLNGLAVSSSTRGERVAWEFTSTKRILEGRQALKMSINPSAVVVKQPKRWKFIHTLGQTAFMHFTNKDGSNNDIVTLNFSGMTGSMDYNEGDAAALDRWTKFQDLYALSREPILLPDGTTNVFYVVINTRFMPFPVRFEGFYNTVLELAEDATEPNMMKYSMEFTVSNSYPSLDDLVEAQQTLGVR